mmetsp:Transcript_7975/g.22750  ORF Transcript_7975/g.22750 Transcript_7975/m.22750 type:complete len:209 (+) Transcript_7975:214-840(+)
MTSKPKSKPALAHPQRFVETASGINSANAMQHITPATATRRSSINCCVTCSRKMNNAATAPRGSARPAAAGARNAFTLECVASYVATARVMPSGMLCKATAMQIVIPSFRPDIAETATAKPSGMLCAVNDANNKMANRVLRRWCCFSARMASATPGDVESMHCSATPAVGMEAPHDAPLSAASPKRQNTRHTPALTQNNNIGRHGSSE